MQRLKVTCNDALRNPVVQRDYDVCWWRFYSHTAVMKMSLRAVLADTASWQCRMGHTGGVILVD